MLGLTDPGREDWVATSVGGALMAPGTRLINWATARPFSGNSVIRSVPTTSVKVGVAESTTGAEEAPAETVTDSVVVPTLSCTSMVAVWSATSLMLCCTYLSKPGASTVRV